MKDKKSIESIIYRMTVCVTFKDNGIFFYSSHFASYVGVETIIAFCRDVYIGKSLLGMPEPDFQTEFFLNIFSHVFVNLFSST